MTTVAFREGTMAADSMATMSGVKFRNETKLFRVRDAVIGIAGCPEAGQLFLDWYGEGAKPLRLNELPDLAEENDFDALVATRKGLFLAHSYFKLTRINDPFIAIGTGAAAAMAAMYCGKTATQAVQIAARVDRDTGGTVRHMRLDDTKGRR